MSFRDFLRGPEGRPALTGCAASVLITIGSFGAAAVRVHDVALEETHLSWLRFGHGLMLSSIAFWVGIAVFVVSWVRLGRFTLAGRIGLPELRGTLVLWVVPLLIAVPLYSRDAYSYLAQGALLRDGLDPYQVGPVVDPNPILDDVSGIWTTTTAPYGPAFILLAKFVTQLCGDDVTLGTIALRIVMLPGLALMVWGVPALAWRLGVRPAVATWFSVLNPLLVIHLIGGVHNETLMVGLLLAGIVLVLDRKHVAGVAVLAVAVAVKGTAGIALPFVVWIWYHHLREDRSDEARTRGPVWDFVRVGVSSVLLFAAVFAGFTLAAGVGIGWLKALAGAIKIINYISIPTALAQLVTLVASPFTALNLMPVLAVTRTLGVAALVIALLTLWWRFRQDEKRNVEGIVWSLLAVCLLSPASLPWYYTWPLAVSAGMTLSPRAMAVVAGCVTWVMAVFMPTGSIGLYSWWNVLLAAALGVLTGWSLLRPDPLHVREFLGLSELPPVRTPATAPGE
ncbi:alpha-(1-_6)-mannopyranosyltransferase A [Tsukamurella sp. 8F]|uniref:alpha-(1->6)-mannopyranosyltransferase A n=1 Tax=unclassified Tsukamurella TaxID=2633480 RepID=UPI0023B8F956|nr:MULTISPECIES: alpha-(1->6)-mannopyranosyltransferase A [unclassified Tsukamurella]MDF0532024.1 alpha-(1->6)-mannopyranosyltransferase A [Tsukamurella sp. 8J]MDF0588429.1 alpha-(1->6)-mannopyranosyltransferase A [Tsukamurella sp. 8F]